MANRNVYFDALDDAGNLVDADSLPTGVLYDGAAALGNSVTIAHPPTPTGCYVAVVDDTGLVAGKLYLLRLTVVIDGVTSKPAALLDLRPAQVELSVDETEVVSS